MEKQKTELENTDFVAVARSYHLTPQELAEFLKRGRWRPHRSLRRRNRRKCMRTKRISLLVALVFLIGAMTLPMTAFAAGGKDTTPPTLTAVLDGETVKIVSSDDNSGVEAVYIDKTRVNSLVDGKASVALKDYAGTDKK